jgi:GNAT superfamily N-acetyltransferase
VNPAGCFIRLRQTEDLDACVRVLAEVHAADRYPLIWPRDPRDWLTPKGLLAAWVASEGDRLLGHVALREPERDGAAIWSTASGLPPASIAAVSALFVAPEARGRGLGAALLNHVQREARSRGRHAALEVLERDEAAIALYERSGWMRVRSERAAWAREQGTALLIHYYVAPARSWSEAGR